MLPGKFKYYLCLITLIAAFFCPFRAQSFSILAHEAIIDAGWDRTLMPLLIKKYPGATNDELIKAHAYAYGGSLVADMGYMPGGNAYFTDLLHYVRSGDFIINLINEARNLNEYAFALGALSHYMADEYGHSLATNVTVPVVYPKLKKKFGSVVTYDDDHTSHSRMEFTYDAVQVGRSNYASIAYHDFIGFNVARAPLERAFLKTYGQELNVLFKNFDSSVSTMRWGVKNLFPALTKTAWNAKKKEIMQAGSTVTKRSFRYKMSRRMYNQEFAGKHNKPDFKARALAFLVKIMPKIGPLKSLKLVYPGAEGETRFTKVFDTIVVNYAWALKQWDNHTLNLPDINLDTGKPLVFGQYRLADETYCKLVLTLQKNNFAGMTVPLQAHLTAYFNGAILHNIYKDHPEDEPQMLMALRQMQLHPAITVQPLNASAW